MDKRRLTISASVLRSILKSPLISLFLLIAVVGSVVTAVLPPLALEAFITKLVEGKTVWLPGAVGYFALIALAGLFDAAKQNLIVRFGQRITHSLRTDMLEKLNRLGASYFVENKPGAVVSRFIGDVDTLEQLFTTGIISMIVDACRVVSILAVIFVKSAGLGLMMVLCAVCLFFLTRMFQRRMLAAQMRRRAAAARISGQIPESIRNIRTIRVFSRERFMERKYDAAIREGFDAVEENNFYDAVYSPIVVVVSAVIVAIMMVLSAGNSLFAGLFGISVGTAVAMIEYVTKVFAPLESIGMELQSLQSAVAGVRRIRDFFKEPERKIPADCPVPEGGVNLKNVRFGYIPEQTVLEDLSFAMEPGENVTLVGRTGAGKSTVFRLLLGLYAPQQGEIRIGDFPVGEISDHWKRRIFGYVEQSFHLVSGSVLDQITLGDPLVSQEMALHALEIVGLMQTVEELPQGADTICTAALFSQGQLQLLSIARAVASDPRVLLLDEITANLDSGTEKLVMEALHQASQNRTVLSISHRLYETGTSRKISI